MKVLWLSHMLPYPPVSGALSRAHHLLAGAAARHEVTLVSFTQRQLLKTRAAVEESRRALEEICARVLVHEIPAERSRAAFLACVARAGISASPYLARRFAAEPYRRDVARLAALEAFDLVHVDTIGLAPYLADAPGIPVALDHHNIESHLIARRAAVERHPLRRAYLAREAAKIARLERRYAPRAVNLVCSAIDAARLAEVAPDAQAVVCPNATDPDYFRPGGVPPEPGRLVFVGGLTWSPNASGVRWFVREVWPQLAAARPDVSLTVIGADPPEDLRRAAALDPRLVLAGQVPDIRPHLDRAAVFICPILDGGGTRLKVLDALAMARPVVSTTIGCEGIDLEPEREVLLGDTPETFGRQVLRALGDPALCARLGAAGRALVLARYSWPQVVTRMLEAYAAEAAVGAGATDARRRPAARAYSGT
jgi:glycosyltransferase involved in cell wall biosynthesis